MDLICHKVHTGLKILRKNARPNMFHVLLNQKTLRRWIFGGHQTQKTGLAAQADGRESLVPLSHSSLTMALDSRDKLS